MAVRLFIGNLPYDVTEAELRAHFAAVGPLASLALPTDRDTGRPRGFAFVEFQRTGRRRGSDTSPQQSGVQGPTAGGERSTSQGRSYDPQVPLAPLRLDQRSRLTRAPETAGPSAQTRPRGAGASRRRARRKPSADRSVPCTSALPAPTLRRRRRR